MTRSKALASLACLLVASSCNQVLGNAPDAVVEAAGGTPLISGPSTGGAAAGGASTGRGAAASRELRPVDGWVGLEANTVGAQGPIYVAFDPGGSSINPIDFTDAGNAWCVAGVVVEVPCDDESDWDTCDFDGHWGAVTGLNLNQKPGSAIVGVYDAAEAGVTGFSFTISGPEIPANVMRFKVGVDSDPEGQYCIEVGSGTTSVQLSELRRDCWADGGMAPDPTELVTLQWEVRGEPGVAHSFDLCIENLTAL